jgi:tRNA(Ile)-lysidine synthase
LLSVRRSELRKFLRAKGQSWREDATNRDTTKMRARIRRKLVPLLEKQFQPAIVNHLATLADLAREDEAFFEAVVDKRAAALIQRSTDGTRIAVEDLLNPCKKKTFNTESAEDTETTEGTRALSARLVRRIVEDMKPRAGELGARHVEAVLEMARLGQNGSSLSLPGGVKAHREQDELVFQATRTEKPGSVPDTRCEYVYNIDLANGGAEVRVAELRCVFRLRVIDWPRKRGETSKESAVLDRDRLRLPVVLRNWRPGDRLRPLGHQKAHKLKRLLNEKRISRWKREGWPVLTSGGILAWARGFPVAVEFAADERTRAGMVVAEEAW